MPKKQPLKNPPPGSRSECAVACGLDVFGDRWTLLVVRDLVLGRRRYGEFAASPEGIPTNILADRLVRLEEEGIVTRTPYQQNPPRFEYNLTTKGEALRPILQSIVAWSKEHLDGTPRMETRKTAEA